MTMMMMTTTTMMAMTMTQRVTMMMMMIIIIIVIAIIIITIIIITMQLMCRTGNLGCIYLNLALPVDSTNPGAEVELASDKASHDPNSNSQECLGSDSAEDGCGRRMGFIRI